mmetsp:Transcript_19520/g.47121  ORF Transcript_19520/g.47121 Transcript_19520/m.47121 type:complete len:227 (+) Transcript_19520:104-784(+)
MSTEETETKPAADAAAPADAEADADEEEDLEKLQAEIERMEAEAARITKETEELERKKEAKLGTTTTSSSSTAATGSAAAGDKKDEDGGVSRDGHSIYVGQVDYGTTPEELLAHFEACGTVERVTIVCDKYTGKPKGFAYLEFQTEAAVENAVKLDGSEFKGRNLKVTHKRVNVSGFHYQQEGGGRGYGGRGGRGGRGFRGGGRGRGGYRGGRGFRGRGRGGYHPY